MPAYKPHSVTIFPWLRANLGKHCLAPLTSTDTRALRAAVEIIELYAYDRSPELIDAFSTVVGHMQEHLQFLAYHAIAHVMDWSTRDEIWIHTAHSHPSLVPGYQRCACEPR